VKIKATFSEHQGVVAALADILQNDARIEQLRRYRVIVDDRVRSFRIMLDSTPSKRDNIIRENYQNIYAIWIASRDELREIDLEIGLRIGQRPAPGNLQQIYRNRDQLEETFRKDVSELRRMVNATSNRYEELGRDEQELKGQRAASQR